MEVSKDEKERLLDAKIASMRAKNAQRAQRHNEVEQDKKQAEKFKMSVTNAPKVKEEDVEDSYESPFQHDKAKQRSRGRQARPEMTAENVSGKNARKTAPGSGRLGENDAPPPDPGYRFLADRMRDGSDAEEEEEGGRREVRRKEESSWSRGGRGGGWGSGEEEAGG